MSSFFSSGDRKTVYVECSPDLSQSSEERLMRLKTELREHIRSLGDYKFLSVEWVHFVLRFSFNQLL